MMSNKKEAMVFIDGSNLYADWKTLSDGSMDMERFMDTVRETFPDYEIKRFYFYCTSFRSEGHEKFLRRVGYIPYVEVIAGSTKTRIVDTPEGEIPVVVDRGTDVNIAVDMVYHAMKGHCEAQILVSRDSDFVRAIQRVKDVGVSVEICVFEQMKAQAQEVTFASDRVRGIQNYEALVREVKTEPAPEV